MGGRGREEIFFESLENRRLLAGDVAASVERGALILRGDDAANSIVIQRQADRTSFLLTPLGDTTINGSSGSLVVSGVVAGMLADLGGGDDALTFDNVRVFGTVTIDAGDGNDALLVRSSRITGDLIVRGGEGRDQIAVRKSIVQHDLHLDGGAEKDRFLLSRLHVRNGVNLTDTSGSSLLYVNRLAVDGHAAIRSGNAIDHVTIDASTFKSDAALATAGGDDQILVRDTVFRGASPMDGGSGRNTIDRQVVVGWDFRNGAQGWEADFADISPVTLPGDPSDGRLAYMLEAGIQPLPRGAAGGGTGFKLSSLNLSDDIFMHLKRGLGRNDGLVAGQQYMLSFVIELISSEHEKGTLCWGESLSYLKAGASSIKPELVKPPPNEAKLRLNIDIGNQSHSGNDVSVVSDSGNGVSCDDEVDPFASVRRRHTHIRPVMASSQGELWLVMGLDVTFEVKTTYFFGAVSAKLTPISSPE